MAAAGLSSNDPLGETLRSRSDIFDLTAVTLQAALKPNEPGGLSHGQRAALAARMARLNGEEAIAIKFADKINDVEREGKLADPSYAGESDERVSALLRHTDLATKKPKDATSDDIERLKQAGFDDADIVRLSELIAFMSYYFRVVAGLRLMGMAS